MKVVAEYSQRFPRNVELLAYRLERSVAKGDVDAVAGLLADLPAEVESDNRFWRYRGWLRMTNGELAEAEGCFRKAIELNVYDYLSRHQLASVLRRSKRMEEVKVLEEVAVEGKDLHNELFRRPPSTRSPWMSRAAWCDTRGTAAIHWSQTSWNCGSARRQGQRRRTQRNKELEVPM